MKIADDSEVGGQPIQVDAHNGVVVLTGKVTNDKLKSKVEKIAKKVKGVTGVDDTTSGQSAASPNGLIRRRAKVLEPRALLRFLTLCE